MKRLKKIIKALNARPERIVLWLFLIILVSMGSYLIMRWHAKEPPGYLIPIERPLPEVPVLVNFSGLLMERGSYRKGFPRDPFSRLPLVPDPDLDPVLDPVPIIIIREPLPRLTEVMVIGSRRMVSIRIGRETHRVIGGEDINGWKVLSVGEESVILYNEKIGKELILAFRR